MSQARGYKVGGTVRIVVNNQVGFTTSNPRDTRSTMYCTDIAKMVQAPIFHVNADDPEAVAFVTRVAIDYRNEFKRDVVIDLVCYRRHGHNEADEPNATQPLMYQKIKKHPTPRKLYADKLGDESIVDLEKATYLINEYRDQLDSGECVVKEWRPMQMHSVDWSPYLGHDWTVEWPNTFDKNRLIELGKRVCQHPETHKLHSRVAKLYKDRQLMMDGDKKLDWGMAETLAYATLLDEGKRIRITGQIPVAVPSSTAIQCCITKMTPAPMCRFNICTISRDLSMLSTLCFQKRRYWHLNTVTQLQNQVA